MSKEMEFFIYLMEHYANYKSAKTEVVMENLKKLDLIDEIFNRYEFYHIEKLENAYEDIDKLICNAKKDI